MKITHRCYLIAIIVQNPFTPDVPPMVYRIQFASSSSLTLISSPGMRNCDYTQAILMETESSESYGDAQKIMEAYILSSYCPQWIKDRIQITSKYSLHRENNPDGYMNDRERHWEDFCTMQNKSRDVVVMMNRPWISQGGEILSDEIFEIEG